MARVARLGVVIDSSGAKRGAQETNSALQSIDNTAKRTLQTLKSAAAALGVAFGVRGLQQAVDQYTLLDARLRQVAGSGAAFARVQSQLFAIAQQTRASYAATVDLYTRLARSSDQLGISQAQLVSVTEAVSNAVRLSNASTGAAEAGLVQLGQAFASGTLRGDELRSIMEQLPQVAKSIADGLGVPIGKLREMGEAGELSGRRVALALDSQREKLALLAGEIPTTIGQALTQLNNAFGLVVAGSDEAKSATEGIAGAIGAAARFMVEYQDAVKAVALGLGATGLVVALTSASAGFTTITGVATAAWVAITGPIGLAVAGFAAVTTGIYLLIKAFKDNKSAAEKAAEALDVAKKSAEETYLAAKNLAAVNWASPAQLQQIQNLGGALNAARTGGRHAVDAFRMAADQWKDTGDQARTFAQALAEGDQKAKTLLATSRAQVQLSGQVESALDRQARAQQAAAKATEERKAIEREYLGQVVQLGIELAERARAADEARAEALRDGAVALATMVASGAKNAEALRAEIAALVAGGEALRQYTAQQEFRALVEDGLNRAKAAGLALTPQVLAAIVSEAKETQKLVKLRDALKGVEGSPFTLPKDTADGVRGLDSALTSVVGTLREVSQALNGTGSDAVRMLGVLASALDGLARAQERAKALAKANQTLSGSQRVAAGVGGAVGAFGGGFAVGSMTTSRTTGAIGGAAAGAATGAAAGATIAGPTAGISVLIGAGIGALIGGIGGLLGASKNATQQLIAQRAAQEQLNQALVTLRASFAGDGLSQALAQASAQFSQLRQQTEAAFAGRKNETERNRVLVELNTLEQQRLAIIRQQFEEGMRLAMGDLEVRRLRATGASEEADRLAVQLAQQKELNDAIERFGKDSPYVAVLRDVQAAETAAAAATRQRLAEQQALQLASDRRAFGLDLTQRRQTLAGDTRGAFITGQSLGFNSAIAEAQRLVDAGVITAEMFEELRVVLGEEMVDALRRFDEAVAEAKAQTLEDLGVRALVAQGRGAEAEQARIEIANRRELLGVTDEVVRAEILRVQGLEATARETARLMEAEKKRVDEAKAQFQSIADRELEAIRILAPERAKEIEADRKRLAREQEIAAAVSETVANKLREIHAMEDAAEAAKALAAAQAEQARIAKELAEFTASLNVQYLRSQGRNFDADVAELNEWRTEQRRQATELGAGADVLAQIDAIFSARFNELISRQMASAAPAPVSFGDTAPTTVLGEDTVAVRSARSITEATALQLVDYAASQTALLRRLVQLAEGGSGPTGNALPSPSLDVVDRQLGTRASDTARLLAGRVR